VLLKPGRKAGDEDNLAPVDDGEAAGGDDGGGDDGGSDDGGSDDAGEEEPTHEETDAGTVADGDAEEPLSGSCGCSSRPNASTSIIWILLFTAALLIRKTPMKRCGL
jgi:hypothetical protein